MFPSSALTFSSIPKAWQFTESPPPSRSPTPPFLVLTTWCWRRPLRVPWTARRSNQSILKEISPGYSLEGLMLKLKLQYFGHLMRRVDSLEKTRMLGGIGGRRRRGRQRMRWLNSIIDSMDVSLSELREIVMDRVAWGAAIRGVAKNRTRLSDWTELNTSPKLPHKCRINHRAFKSFWSTCPTPLHQWTEGTYLLSGLVTSNSFWPCGL